MSGIRRRAGTEARRHENPNGVLCRQARAHAARHRASGGFTLVEIMVVVTVIGVLAAMAIAAFGRAQRRARNTHFAAELRTFEQAFELFAFQNGGWPPSASGGALPTGMDGYLNEQSWRARNVLGGAWSWEHGSSGVVAAISTSSVAVNDGQMREVDAMIDNGNLSTGRFRKVGGRYLFVLEE